MSTNFAQNTYIEISSEFWEKMADVGFQKCSKSGWKIAEFGEKK